MKNILKEITEFTMASIDSEIYGSLSPYDNIHAMYELDDECIVHPTLDILHAMTK